MFFERVDEELTGKGFEHMSFIQPGLYGYVYKEAERDSCVIFVNLPDDLPENIMNVRYSIRRLKYEANNLSRTRFLFIYLTNQPDKMKWVCEEPEDTHWILDREQLRLYIYENQTDDFCGVKQYVEKALIPDVGIKKKYTSYVTAGIVALNIAVYVFMYVLCNSEQRDLLIENGGLYWPAIVNQHEIWRYLTSMFMHFGISHLFNNMLLLFFIGDYVEDYIGHMKFLVLYLTSGILAGVVSMGYNSAHGNLVISCGASGAIFGIAGALACFIFLARGIIKDITGPRLVVFIGLSILSGMQSQGIDNMAHIGGLISGFLLALIITLCLNGKGRNQELSK